MGTPNIKDHVLIQQLLDYLREFEGLVSTTGGEANTASNIGTEGEGLFKQKTNVNLEFKNLSTQTPSEIEVVADDYNVYLNYVGTHSLNTASNVGAEGVGVYSGATGLDLEFKNVVGKTGMQAVNNATNKTIELNCIATLAEIMANAGNTVVLDGTSGELNISGDQDISFLQDTGNEFSLNRATGSIELRASAPMLIRSGTTLDVIGVGGVDIQAWNGELSLSAPSSTFRLSGAGTSVVESGTLILQSTNAGMSISSAGHIGLDDQYLTSSITLSEAGQPALNTTSQSLVGAINEVEAGVSAVNFQSVYDATKSAQYTVNIDTNNLSFDVDQASLNFTYAGKGILISPGDPAYGAYINMTTTQLLMSGQFGIGLTSGGTSDIAFNTANNIVSSGSGTFQSNLQAGHNFTSTAGAISFNASGDINATSGLDLNFLDQHLISSITLSEAGVTALNTTSQSLVGAINEVNAKDISMQSAYDGGSTLVTSSTEMNFITTGAPLSFRASDGTGAAGSDYFIFSYNGPNNLSINSALHSFGVFCEGGTVDVVTSGAGQTATFASYNGKTIIGGISGSSADTQIQAGQYLILSDGNFSASTYDTDFYLSDNSAEWDLFETNYGEVSLLNAINQAANTSVSDPNAVHVDTSGEVNGVAQKTLPVGEDIVLIEDSGDSFNKKKITLDSLIHFSYEAAMLGNASSTLGLLCKAPADQGNPGGVPLRNPFDTYSNGQANPFVVTGDQEIIAVHIVCAAATVSGATVGASPTIRIDVYEIGYDVDTLIETIRVPLVNGSTGVGIYNNLSGSGSIIAADLILATPIALANNTLLGFDFVNESTDNNTINGVSRITVDITTRLD